MLTLLSLTCVALAALAATAALLAYRWRRIARRETRTHLELLTAIRFAPATHPEVAAMACDRLAALAAVDEHAAGGEQR